METAFNESLRKFNALIDEIEKDHQNTIVKEAEKLASDLGDPTSKDARVWWDKLWEKPLYTWTNTGASKKWKQHCEPYFGIDGAWQNIKRDRDDFLIAMDKSKKPTFVAHGQKIGEIHAQGVPLKRLYSMVGAAKVLAVWEEDGKLPIQRSSELNADIVKAIRDKLGHGWGHVTVLHFLTDFGLACKPDMHLNASCQYLGMKIRNPKSPSLEEAVAIVEFVKRLVAARWGSVSADRLRYTDKCLMEASDREVLPIDPWYKEHQDWLKVSFETPLSEKMLCRWEVDGVTIHTSKPKSYKKTLRRDVDRIFAIENGKLKKLPKCAKTLNTYKQLVAKKAEGKNLSFFAEQQKASAKPQKSKSSNGQS